MREPQFLLKKILSFKLVSNPETEMTARSWCAARAMEHPLDRVWCIWARREGQSAEISPTEMTCSRYSATRVLNSCTVLRKTNHHAIRKDTILLCDFKYNKYNKHTLNAAHRDAFYPLCANAAAPARKKVGFTRMNLSFGAELNSS